MTSNKFHRDEDFIKKFELSSKEIRKSKWDSQEELAFGCVFELSPISRKEIGTINTSISHISAIADSLEIAPRELFIF